MSIKARSSVRDLRDTSQLRTLFDIGNDPRKALIQTNYEDHKELIKEAYRRALRANNRSGLKTVEFILKAYRYNGFHSDIIYGPQGYGKSSYALQLGYYVYRDWRLVFLHFFVDPLQLLDFLRFLRNEGLRAPLVIIDDAGMLFGRIIYLVDRRRYTAIKGIYDLARSGAAAMLYTTPIPSGLSYHLRNSRSYLTSITISPEGRHFRDAVKYVRYPLPSGRLMIRKVFIERFNVYLPPRVYKFYSKLRASYIELIYSLISAIPTRFLGVEDKAEIQEVVEP